MKAISILEPCAFCGSPATKYHLPQPIKNKVFPKIPICSGKCAGKKSK